LVLLPAFLVIFIEEPILLAMSTSTAAILFPDHFTDQLGYTIELHGETQDQLSRILDVFREELDTCGDCHSQETLKSVFAMFDIGGKGWVSEEEFHMVLQQKHLYSFLGVTGEKQIRRLMKLFDPEQNGHFNYISFAEGLYKHAGVGQSQMDTSSIDMYDSCCSRERSVTIGHQFDDDLGHDLHELRRSKSAAILHDAPKGAWFNGPEPTRSTIHHDVIHPDTPLDGFAGLLVKQDDGVPDAKHTCAMMLLRSILKRWELLSISFNLRCWQSNKLEAPNQH